MISEFIANLYVYALINKSRIKLYFNFHNRQIDLLLTIVMQMLGGRGEIVAGDVLACLATLARLHARQHPGPMFFLARDGWLPWVLLKDEIDGDYLEISRLALRAPLMVSNPSLAARWCIDPVACNTPRSVLAKLGVGPETLSEVLVEAGFGLESWDEPLGRSGRRRFAQLFSHPSIGSILSKIREDKGPLVRAYLQRLGILDSDCASILDIGWNGSCHLHLQQWRAEEGRSAETLGGCYLGLQSRSAFGSGTPLSAVWEPSGEGSGLFRHPSFYVLAEMFLTANHGGVVGYEYSPTGRVEPSHAPHNRVIYDNWGLPAFQESVIERARSRMGDSESDLLLLAKETAGAFLAFATRPSRQDSARFGQWPACVDAAHGEGFPLAPKMSIPEIWNFFVHRRPQPVLWMEAAEARLEGLPLQIFRLGRRLDSWIGWGRAWVSRLVK